MQGSEEKAITVNMGMSGEWLTNHVRLMVLSDDWRGAWRVLTEGLKGQSEEQTQQIAMGILKGELCLVGDTSVGINSREQDPDCSELQRYLNTLKFQNAGLCTINGKAYRPHARIQALDDHDYRAAHAKLGSFASNDRFVEERAMYYAPSNDYKITLPATKQIEIRTIDLRDETDPGEFLVMWEPRPDYPMWIKPFTNVKEAIADFVEARGFSYYSAGADTYYMDLKKDSTAEYEAFLLDVDSELSESQEDERNELLDKRHAHHISGLRDQILARLGPKDGEDWIRIPVHKLKEDIGSEKLPDHYVHVPKLPFQHWSLESIPAEKLGVLEPWEPVSRSGMKMQNDSAYHTDWVIGAGFDPDDFNRNHDLINSAAWHERFKYAQEAGSFEVVPLCKSTRNHFTGKVRWVAPGEALKEGEVGVIPHAGVEYDAALRSAAKHGTGIICKVGGALAHVVVVGRELDVPVVMWDKADSLTQFHSVWVNTRNGTLSFH